MRLHDILKEYELGRDENFEKEIKNRKEMLGKKIVKLGKSKEKSLRKVEKKADKAMMNNSDEITDEISSFIIFAMNKLEEYDNKIESITLPVGMIPTITGAMVKYMKADFTKTDAKLIKKVIEKEKKKDIKEVLKTILDIQTGKRSYEDILTPDEIPGLDEKDLEEFVAKVSKDKALKNRIASLNRRLVRLTSKKAETELADAGSGKKIDL